MYLDVAAISAEVNSSGGTALCSYHCTQCVLSLAVIHIDLYKPETQHIASVHHVSNNHSIDTVMCKQRE